MKGDLEKPKISSGQWAPCSTGSPARGMFQEPICISVLAGGVVRGSVWLQCIFFENSFSVLAHFMMGDLCTHLTEYSAIFDQKNGVTPMPHPPYLTQSTFFVVSPDEKSPQKEMFCQCRRDETKNSRNTKRHQNRQVQKLF